MKLRGRLAGGCVALRAWARAQGPAMARRAGLFLLLDVVAAGLCYAWLAARLVPDLLRDARHSFHPGFMQGVASDLQGTAWFYWWYARAAALGVDPTTPDVVCAPTGQPLGQNFPQHLDAWFARYFLDGLGFPAGFDLFMVATLAASALAGHLGLRALTRSRLLAFAGGALYGFSAYGVHELQAGRPTVALVAFLPLFVACWVRTLAVRGWTVGAWILAAGLCASLAIQHYVLYAGLLALFAVVTAAACTVVPAPGVARWHPALALVLVGAIGLGCSMPYLHELLQRRPLTSDVAAQLSESRPYDPGAWLRAGETLLRPRDPDPTGRTAHPAPELGDAKVRTQQQQALPVSYLWGGVEQARPPRAYLPPVLLLVAFAGLTFGRGRALAWLGTAALFYSLTLGPAACTAIQPVTRHLVLGGHAVPMLSYLLLWKAPWVIGFWHPERAFPMVLLCLLASAVVGAEGLGRSAARLAGGRLGKAWPAALVPALVGLLLGAMGLRQAEGAGAFELRLERFEPDPLLVDLASEEGQFAVIDLPLGLGHGLGVSQIIHGRPRANSHHDSLTRLHAGLAPPDDCYRLPLLRGLWDLQILARGAVPPGPAGLPGEILPATDAAAIQQAIDAGFRYAVLFPAGIDPLEAGADGPVELLYAASLTRVFGPPTRQGTEVVVWSLADALARARGRED